MSEAQKDRRLTLLMAAIALGDWDLLREVRETAPAGEPDTEWREAFLMSHLFAGFPRAVEAAVVLQRAGGLGQPEPSELRAEPDLPEAGAALFETIYQDQTEAVRGILAGAHPELERWIIGHAYGRVLARPGLSAARRELLAVAALAVLGQNRQLSSHVRGARRCGASRAQLDAVLDAIAGLIHADQLDACRQVLQRFGSLD